MDENELLIAQIRAAKRYKELISLREFVWGLSTKVEFSRYVDLRKRVDDRIKEFEDPVCEEVDIKIIRSGSEQTFMDIRECRIAIGKGVTLPSYVFSKYPDAEDIEITPLGMNGNDVGGPSSTADTRKKGTLSGAFNPKLGILQSRIENVIKLANYMNETYSRVIPKISTDLHEIVDKLEQLYKRVSNNEYELRG